MSYTVEPIGYVRNDRTDPDDTDFWGGVVSRVDLDERLGDDCLNGLNAYSHVEVVFLFDRSTERETWGLRPPRGRADLPAVGVFAGRGPVRPNRIGVSAVPILSVGRRYLTVVGLDAVDGTPVLDLKPVLRELVPREVRQPDWVARMMADYHRPSRRA